MTRDASSPVATYSDGYSSWATPAWPGDSMNPNASSDFSAYSNEDNNFSVAYTGMPGPFAGPTGVLTLEIVVWVGAGPISLGGSAHPPAPGGGLDSTPRDDVPPPIFETESSGPAPALFGPAVGIASPIPRSSVVRLDTNGNDAVTTFATPLSSTPTSAISSLQMMAMQNAGGRAASGTSMQSGGVLSTQVDHANESSAAVGCPMSQAGIGVQGACSRQASPWPTGRPPPKTSASQSLRPRSQPAVLL